VSSEERDAQALADAVSEHHAGIENMTVDVDPSPADIAAAVSGARECSAAVIGTLDVHMHKSQAALVDAVGRECSRTAVLACGYPADLRYFQHVNTYIACYCWRRPCLQAAAAVVFGKAPAGGHLPVPAL
jgi:hypothetical protein